MKPIGIKINKEHSIITIDWDDGHRSEYPFVLFRNACPCAECRGGHAGMSSSPDQEIFNMGADDSLNYEIQSVNPVGTYAINPVWGDGHQFGIYTWGFLRKLCPCAECRS